MAYVIGQAHEGARHAWVDVPSWGDDVQVRILTSIPMGALWGLSFADPPSIRAFLAATVVEWKGVEDAKGNIVPFAMEILDQEPSTKVTGFFMDVVRGIGNPQTESSETSSEQ